MKLTFIKMSNIFLLLLRLTSTIPTITGIIEINSQLRKNKLEDCNIYTYFPMCLLLWVFVNVTDREMISIYYFIQFLVNLYAACTLGRWNGYFICWIFTWSALVIPVGCIEWLWHYILLNNNNHLSYTLFMKSLLYLRMRTCYQDHQSSKISLPIVPAINLDGYKYK